MRFLTITASVVALATIAVAVTESNFRVTTGYGDRSSDYVRVTFVNDADTTPNPAFENFFSYNAQFKYRWTGLKTHSTLVSVTPGLEQAIAVPGAVPFNLTIPKPGQGVRGIMTADICYSSPISTCEVGEHDEILSHLPALLNAIFKSPDMNFWTLLGDAFYDETGATTNGFWSQLSTDVKRTVYYTVPGNYEFWASGNPDTLSPSQDQFGNGFMQYHGMDTLASATDPVAPWNFVNDPDDDSSSSTGSNTVPGRQYLSDVSNFELVTQLGNLGFIGYSGAHSAEEIMPFLEAACRWMGNRADTIDWIILLGHWAKPKKGATDNTYIEAVFYNVSNMSGCDARKVKYFTGHHHCNEVQIANQGWIVGGFGKTSHTCSMFGIPFVDSTGGRLQVVYFPISNQMVPSLAHHTEAFMREELRGAHERYAALQACVNAGSIANCMHLDHTVWLNESKSW